MIYASLMRNGGACKQGKGNKTKVLSTRADCSIGKFYTNDGTNLICAIESPSGIILLSRSLLSSSSFSCPLLKCNPIFLLRSLQFSTRRAHRHPLPPIIWSSFHISITCRKERVCPSKDHLARNCKGRKNTKVFGSDREQGESTSACD